MQLNEEEKHEFLKFVEGQGEKIIKERHLEPWYTRAESNGLIEDPNEENNCNIKLRKNIPKIAELLGDREPSGLLKYNLVEIVYAYCFLFRLFVGDFHGDHQIEIIDAFLSLSFVLNPFPKNKFQAFHSTAEAIKSIFNLSLLVCFFSFLFLFIFF